MFNYNHLYYFYVTAKATSVTAAAKTLRIAQPSLSAQLKTLESQLDQKLFQRVGRQLELTEQGHRIYGYCRRMFEIAEDLSHVIRDFDKNHVSRLSIGVTNEIDRPFVVELVSKIIRNETRKSIPVVTMCSDQHVALIGRLRNRSVDVVMTNQPAYDDDLEILSSTKMPVVLAFSKHLPADGALKKAKAQELRTALELLPRGWVMPASNQRLRSEIDTFLEKKRLTAKVLFESDVLASVVRGIADGVGIGFLPLPYFAKEMAQDLIDSFGPREGFWQHSIWLIARKTLEPDPLISELKPLFKKVSASFPES